MTQLRRLGIGLAVAAFVMFAVPSAVPATHASRSCKRAKSKTVAENRLVRVFSRPTEDPVRFGDDVRVLVGCWKRTGRGRLLGTAEDNIITTGGFGLVRLRGRFVAYSQDNLEDCRYGECDGPGWHPYHLHRIDMRSGRNLSIGIYDLPVAGRLLLDKHGAIAWPRPLLNNEIVIRAVDADGARAVDSGAIDPKSLRLSTSGKLSWIKDNQTRSIQLDHTR